jgi:glycerol uptake facilitator-like aquaporin
MQNLNSKIFFFSQRGNIYYAKIVLIEIVNTFFLILSYLLVIYKPSLRTVDEILKGLALGIILWVCYFLSAGAGACYNPALTLAQTTYQVGYLNTLDQNGNGLRVFSGSTWSCPSSE